MRRFQFGLTALSSFGFIMTAPAAFAGNCATAGGQNCHPGVVYASSSAPRFDPVLINERQPLQGLRSVNIRTAPTVSITRLYGQQPLASIHDAPSGFTGGCHPTSTQYCRQNVARPNIVRHQAPAPRLAVSPILQPNVQIGGGYNAAAFQPRQYGENIFTPGIAYIPTSYVDRNPHTANRLLASGLTRSHQTTSHHTVSSLPVVSGHSQTGNAVSSLASDGTYWEKVSGPTLFGNTLATQVVCKRQAPVQHVQTVQVQRQVVRPIIPVPVAAPVYCENTVINSRYGHTGLAQPAPHSGGPFIQAPLHQQPQVQAWPQQNQGRWTY